MPKRGSSARNVHLINRLFSTGLRGVDAQEVEVEVKAHGADKPIINIARCQIKRKGLDCGG